MTLGELRQALLALRAPDFRVSGEDPLVVDVVLGDRHQEVRILDDGDWFLVRSHVCRFDDLGMSEQDLAEEVFRRNHEREFLAFGRADGHVVGWIDLPSDVSVDELTAHLRRLATECDRWEARLTGEDR